MLVSAPDTKVRLQSGPKPKGVLIGVGFVARERCVALWPQARPYAFLIAVILLTKKITSLIFS
jgi:hypothetical protein